MKNINNNVNNIEEITARSAKGMPMLIINILLMIVTITAFVFSIIMIEGGTVVLGVILCVVTTIYYSIVGPILFAGLKILKPNEALVLTLFGEYVGTLKGPGFYFVNPFVSALNPASTAMKSGDTKSESITVKSGEINVSTGVRNKKISLKTMTLNNDKQKINDLLGNPIEIGIVVIWKVVNTAKAVCILC